MAIKFVNIDEVINLTLVQFRELVGPELVLQSTRDAIDEIREIFVRAFTRTKFYNALLDQAAPGAGDFFATMGIDPLEGISIAGDILTIIENSIKVANIDLRTAGGRFASASNVEVISWRIQLEDIEQALLSAGFQYDSENGPVPWMQWLIQGGGVAGYDIVYDYSGRFVTSRSGRALMRQNQGFFWALDESEYAEKENFLIDVLEDSQWPSEVEDVLTNRIRENLISGTWTIE